MKKVLIYCCCGNAEKITYMLDEEKYEVIGYIDDNPESWGKHMYGRGGECYSPKEINNQSADIFIISMAVFADNIKKKLVKECGVEENKIMVFQQIGNGIEFRDERIASLNSCVAMLKERNIQGNLAEVGVYKGEFAKLLNRYFPEKKLYLFDTFEGFDTKRDEVEECDTGRFKDTNIELVLNKMVTPENCIVRKGYFPDTAEGIEDTFCLVSLDADLYNPILAGLEFFYPRMQKGGYIFVHDFGTYHFTGVKKAVYEYCNKHGAAVVPVLDNYHSVIVAK
jgi:O-methyltransferase